MVGWLRKRVSPLFFVAPLARRNDPSGHKPLLYRAPKTRVSDHFILTMGHRLDRGWQLEIPDYAGCITRNLQRL
jgi:hypothetical protein